MLGEKIAKTLVEERDKLESVLCNLMDLSEQKSREYANSLACGVGRAGGAVGAFDGGGVDFGEVFDAFARAGRKDGCGDGEECDAV